MKPGSPFGRRELVHAGVWCSRGAAGLFLLSLLDSRDSKWDAVLRLTPGQWTALLFLALVCSALAYAAYNYALTAVDASRAAVFTYIEPVVASLLAIALLEESLGLQTICGAMTIAVSIIIVTRVRE